MRSMRSVLSSLYEALPFCPSRPKGGEGQNGKASWVHREALKFVEDTLRGENESCCVRSTYKNGVSKGKSCGRWMFHRVVQEESMCN